MKRKGAIQMSLGFIITVVFAVVLLSLTIYWIQGFFTGLEPLTVDLTQQAQDEISKVFRTSDKNFAIWPSRYTLDPGSKIIMSAGIKNNDKEGRKLFYVISVISSSTDTSLDTDDMQKWVLVPGDATTIDPAASTNVDMAIDIPSNTPQGNYLFKAYACYGTTAAEAGDPEDCTIESVNIWGSPHPVTISIEG
ncbi:MAG: hypothetical protein KAS04_04740 [Candidatus Aenigmarchaeota archaeon]|nr:hypothetical protein [Candidatus Aenigmarchaeota archaeon]